MTVVLMVTAGRKDIAGMFVLFLYFLSGVDLDRDFEVEQRIKHFIKAFRTKTMWSKCLMLWVRKWNFSILTLKELHLLGVQHS